MNKIYKVIWSKARHQYVVASELAKSVTKGAGSRIGRTAAAVLAAIVLTAGAGLPAQAIEVNVPNYGLADLLPDGTHAHLKTEHVQQVLKDQSLELGSLTVGGENVLTKAAMDGYVQWDSGTTDTIGGVQFTGNGGLSGKSLLTQSTMGGQNYSVKIENGAITTTGNAQSSIGGVTLRNGVVSNLTAGTNDTDAVNVKQMKDADTATLNSAKSYTDGQMDGVVKWDPVLDEDGQPTGEYNKDSIHGVELKDGTIHATGGGDNSINGTLTVGGYTTINADARVQGQMTAAGYHNANDSFTVDENGNLKAAGGIVSGTVSQYAGSGIAIGEGSVTNGVYGVALGNGAQASGTNSTALGRSSSASGSDSVALGDYSVATEANEVSLGRGTIGSNGYIARRLTHVADGINDDDAATVGQMNTAVGEATEGMVKWDPKLDEEGNPIEGEYADSIHGVTLADGGITAAGGNFSVNETGGLSYTGNSSQLIVNDSEAKLAYDDNALLLMDGGAVLTGGGKEAGTQMALSEKGAVFSSNNPADDGTTTISGDAITTGSVTGLTNTEWDGESYTTGRAATEDQLAALNEDVNESIDTATKGVVKWDGLDESTNSIHGVTLTDLGSGNGRLETEELTAGYDNDKLTVNDYGIQMNTHVDGTYVPIISDIIGSDINSSDTTLSMQNGGFNLESSAVTSDGGFLPLRFKGSIDSASMSMDKGEIEMTSSSTGVEASLGGLDAWLNRTATFAMKDGEIQMTASEGLLPDTVVDVTKDGLTVSNGDPALPGTTSTNIKGDVIITGTVNAGDTVVTDGSVTGLSNTTWSGKAEDVVEDRAATEGQLADLSETLNTSITTATDGMVKWDTATDTEGHTTYTEGVLHGLKLEGNTDGTSTFSTISQVNGSSKITLNKDSIKVQADENRADAGELQLTASGALLESGNNGVMVGANGITLGNSQTGGTLEMANDGTATFHAQDKNGTTAISGDELSTGSIYASDGNFVTSGTGTVIQNGEGESLQFDSNGLLIKSEGAQGNGAISMQNGTLSLRNGNADDTTYVDISTSGTTFSHNGDDKTTISGGTITTGTVTGLTNTDWNGTTDNETRAATEGQLADLSATVTENAKNVVKWDNDDQNTIKGVEYQGDGNLKVNDLTAGTLNAADGAVKVDEEGNFSAGNGLFTVSDTGAVSAGMTDGPSFALNESGVHMDAGNGSKLDVTAGGTTFTGADGKQTYINGNEINTGTVLAQEMYVGSKADENTVVTKGQLGTAVDEATEGMVQWDSTTDEEGNPTYQEGSLKGVQFTGEGDLTVEGLTADTLNAADGNFKVDADGSITALTDQSAFILNDSMASLVSNSNRLSITTEGILLNAGDGSSTVTVNRTGTTFTTAQGSTSINGGQVIAGDTMYVHGSATEDNEVATKGDLSTAIGEATDGMVKWDNENENSINGVGLEDGKITAENGGNIGGVEFDGEGNLSTEGSITGGTITATGDLVIGTGENAVNVGEKLDELDTSISGVTGDVSDIKGQIGADAEGNLGLKNEGSTLVEGINKNTEAIENNTSSINGIKDQIGAVGEEGSLGLTNGESTLVGGINTNTSSINTIKNQIGGTGENGALNLANGQTTIESGINYNYAAIQQQGQAINALGGRVHELGEEIDSVGAISSALAGLHPLDYDGTGSKFQLSAAMGTYDGTQAAAIGGFYHFNEDVMLSLGGATAFNGEHKTAANIGVTFRVGPGGSEKKPATPDEVMATLDAMNRKIQEMDAKIAALEQDKKDLTEENQQLKAEAAEAVTAEAPAAEEQA